MPSPKLRPRRARGQGRCEGQELIAEAKAKAKMLKCEIKLHIEMITFFNAFIGNSVYGLCVRDLI